MEIEDGIDANDLGGPQLQTVSHRAGVLKIASGLDKIAPHEQRVFEAAAIAHRRTGAPILTHTERGTAALQQVEVLSKHGVNLRHVVLSHTDRKPDLSYHREILSTGVGVEFDSSFRWRAARGNPTLDLVLALVDEFPNQLMLGMDAARSAYWRAYGGAPGLSFLLTDFSHQLRERGLTENQWRCLFIENPASYFSFERQCVPHSHQHHSTHC